MSKIFPQIAALLALLIAAGFFLRAQANDLLNATLERTLAKQTAILAAAAEERFDKEFASLRLAAKCLEAQQAAQVVLQTGNENISVGLLTADGNAIHDGTPLSNQDFPRLSSAYQGNEVVDYCAGKGVLFAVPVALGDNANAALYRLYDETLAAESFKLAEDNDTRLLIQDGDGKVIVPYKNYGAAEKEFFANAAFQRGFETLRDKLETQTSAAVYCDSPFGDFFLFATKLPHMNYTLVGCVPWESAAGDVAEIYNFMRVGGVLALILLAAGGAYLLVLRARLEDAGELRAAKLAADEANNAKSIFLANMSHKIRTPINAIVGMNEMILRESNSPEIVNYAQNTAAAAETLLSLVNDIRDFSKIESGKFALAEENYRLVDVIKNLVNMIRPRAEQKKLAFNLHVNPAAENILRGDSERIQQIALNFLSNAVKYTESGSVTFSVEGETVSADTFILSLSVKDTGKGIRDISKLVEDCERFDIHKTRHADGTGLGLAITYRLVSMMNGKIDIQSAHGEGATFTALIPQKIAGNELIGVFTEHAHAAQGKYQPAFVAPAATILVVDDDEMNLLVTAKLLQATRIKVDTATSGAACLKKLAERHYDLIFLDLMMPDLDGVQTLERTRAMDENLSKNAPIIALTADAAPGTQQRLIDAGFNDYLTKPIDIKLLEQILVDFLPAEKILSPAPR